MAVHGLGRSLRAYFHYVTAASASPVHVEVPERRVELAFPAVAEVRVSRLLFERTYSCRDYACSRCCSRVSFWNVWRAADYPGGPGRELRVRVNGIEHRFVVEDHVHSPCAHLRSAGCAVYGREPLHCAFPLVKLKRFADRVVVTTERYSRNRYMGCPVEFRTPAPGELDHFLARRFRRWAREADWLGIDRSRLPESLQRYCIMDSAP